jgi:hypothetical protein
MLYSWKAEEFLERSGFGAHFFVASESGLEVLSLI